MTTPQADADLSWGPETYEDALAWRKGKWPPRAILMPTSAVRELYALIDSRQSTVYKNSQKVEDRKKKFEAYLYKPNTVRGKMLGSGARLLTLGVASAALFLSPVLAPSAALAGTIGWTAGWMIANFAAFKTWRITDQQRAIEAASDNRKRLRIPLHEYHQKKKDKLFFWTPRFLASSGGDFC